METIERTILTNLLKNEEFTRKVLPFIKAEYFHSQVERLVFEMLQGHVLKYNTCPTKESLIIDMDKKGGTSEEEHKNCITLVNELHTADPSDDSDWLKDSCTGK